jgi:hypothetical protein
MKDYSSFNKIEEQYNNKRPSSVNIAVLVSLNNCKFDCADLGSLYTQFELSMMKR